MTETPSLAKAAFSTALTEAMVVGFLIWQNTVLMRDVSRGARGLVPPPDRTQTLLGKDMTHECSR
jgi:hypothetical protein